jgi:polyisoprenoid-binding protein YceI
LNGKVARMNTGTWSRFSLWSSLVLAIGVWAVPSSAETQPLRMRVSSTYTNVEFTVYKWTVLKQEGFFRDSSGSIVYDPDDPTRSRVEVSVRVNSLDTRNSGRDQVLRSDDFFDARKYPTMTFVSSHVEPASERNTLRMTGTLTIHGVAKQITVPVKVFGVGTQANAGQFAGFETDFTIDRTDFGVNGTRWSAGRLVISKDVLIHLTVGAVASSCQDAPAQPCR